MDAVLLNEHTARNWKNVVYNMVDAAARVAWLQCMEDGRRAYLYSRESTATHFGRMATFHDDETPPPGWSLAAAEPVMTAALTLEQCRRRIDRAAWNVPILPPMQTNAAGQYTPADGITHD